MILAKQPRGPMPWIHKFLAPSLYSLWNHQKRKNQFGFSWKMLRLEKKMPNLNSSFEFREYGWDECSHLVFWFRVESTVKIILSHIETVESIPEIVF